MGQCGASGLHVHNATSKPIRVRVAQEETVITEIDSTLGLHFTAPVTLDAALKAKLDHILDVTGFARIAPLDTLEYNLPHGKGQSIYVSATTADDPNPLIICSNYSPPYNKSVTITSDLTVRLSKKQSTSHGRRRHAPASGADQGGQGGASQGGQGGLTGPSGSRASLMVATTGSTAALQDETDGGDTANVGRFLVTSEQAPWSEDASGGEQKGLLAD